MYNPYTSEHLNGDLRKEFFISDKCPIVCVSAIEVKSVKFPVWALVRSSMIELTISSIVGVVYRQI